MNDIKDRVVSLRTAEIIENEAADWLTKLDEGNLLAEDRAALRGWLSQSPEHSKALNEMATMWSEMNYLLNDLPEQNKNRTVSIDPIFLWGRNAIYVISILIVSTAGLNLWWHFESDTTPPIFHITQPGEQQLKQLSDGSSIHLNTNTVVEAQYTSSQRTVRLFRGEALFDVAHDPDRPFVVYAGNRQVQAIGTKFVVRMDSEQIQVIVADGRVKLSKREDRTQTVSRVQTEDVIFLNKGEQIAIGDEEDAQKAEPIGEDQLSRSLSWLSGQLVFRNEPLQQVVREVSRYLPNQIVIEDPELRDVRISGRFKIGDTEALLEAIEVSFNVQATQGDGNVIRLSNAE